MNTTKELSRYADDLAGHWTEPALEILKAAGIDTVSVDMELETWHALKLVLKTELRWQRAFRSSGLVSMSMLMEQVLRKATLAVAKSLAPHAVSADFERRLRRLAGDRRATATELWLYAELVRQPALHAAFKPPSRTDFVPRLRVSAAL